MKNLFTLLIFLTPLAGFSQYGVLDSDFDADGIRSFEIGNLGVTRAYDVAVQPDGKIIVLGETELPQPAGLSSFVIRLFPDGSTDQSFGVNGAVAIAGNLRQMTIQPDGKIVLVGAGEFNNTDAVAFVRLNGADGSTDASFGVSGSYYMPFPQGSFLMDVALQSDGKIVAAGFTTESDTDVLLVRLTQDGTPDNTFSFDGVVKTDASGIDLGSALVIGADGKITVAGATNNDGLLIRYNVDGTLDNTFGNSGIAVQNLGIGSSLFNDVVNGEGDKMYVCGWFNGGPNKSFLVAKFNTDGTPDESFGSLGYSLDDLSLNDDDEAMELVYQPDGRVLVVGDAVITGSVGAMIRFNADGSYDQSFGNGGFVTTSIGVGNVYEAVALQEDLKILTVGRSITQTFDEQATVARYTSGMNVGIGEIDAYIGSTLIYPNPITNNLVTVEYELKSDETVSIELFDLSGKMIAQLQPSIHQKAGSYQKTLVLPRLSSGNYLLNLNTEKGSVSVRATLVDQ
ncbi:MAG: T9SS type A sorting domain-containing protein [Flavobacteriales bacterium]|nr:T9SS type A sorting domain-containing protein [Flavobacteriales bacterium]